MTEQNTQLEKEIFYGIVVYTQHSYYKISQQNKTKAIELLEIVLKKNDVEKSKIQTIIEKVKERFDERPRNGVLKNISFRPEINILCEKTEEITRTTCRHIVDTYEKAIQIIKSARIVGNYGTFEIKEIDFSDKIEVSHEYESTVGNCFMIPMTSVTCKLEHFIHNIKCNNLEVDIPPTLLRRIEEYAIGRELVPWEKIFEKSGIAIRVKHTPHITIKKED